MRISDWSSDVCSSDLRTLGAEGAASPVAHGHPAERFSRRESHHHAPRSAAEHPVDRQLHSHAVVHLQRAGQRRACRTRMERADAARADARDARPRAVARAVRSEEHTSELQSLMRISYAVFCLKKKKKNNLRNTMTID